MTLSPVSSAKNTGKEIILFNIPQQRVGTALIQFAGQANLTLIVPFKQVEGKMANRLVGKYPIEEAVTLLLSGTGLQAAISDKGQRSVIVSNRYSGESKNMKTTNRKRYWGSLTAIAALFASAGNSASAQEGNVSQLEEIVVTAQKRTENLQDVPISITTVSEERLNAILDGGADIRGLSGRIPSLYVEGSSGRTAPRFYIRGFGNVDFDLTASQPVSIIMDEVVMENVLLKGFPLFDIQQTEVLRGPQGTLFGRNTPAGIVKFDSKKPTDETEGYISGSVGRYGSIKVDGAVGGKVSDDLSARVAFQYNSRDDYVRNGNPGADFAGNGDAKDDLGEVQDVAFRAHFLYQPTDEFSSLLTLQHRDLDATTTLFRANILSPGSNELNGNFDRETVFYDGGENNPSHVETSGITWKNEFGFDGFTLTSITSYLHGGSNGFGDIDGGTGAAFLPTGSFPGFIPFPVASGSSDTDIDQFTQELRLASNNDGAFNWQVGAFYFQDEFVADRPSRQAIGLSTPFKRLTIITQETDAWAIFGQASYDVSDKLRLTAGLRHSDDERTYNGVHNDNLLSPPVITTTAATSVSDSHLSWDLSANYSASDATTLYARIANGFRGPSIQGKDLSNVTTSESETVNSIEFGAKTQLDRVRLNGSIFYYEVNDQQFTAIGGVDNDNRLVNADKGVGQGFELDAEFLASDNLLITAGISYNDTEIQDSNLSVAPCGGGCTVTDPVVTLTDTTGGTRSVVLLDGNPFPQAPEWIVSLTARYSVPVQSGEVYFFTDWSWTGATNLFLYESEEYHTDGNYEGGARIGYVNDAKNYELALFVRNITDEENLVGGIDFNNLTGFVNEPRIFGVEARYNF